MSFMVITPMVAVYLHHPVGPATWPAPSSRPSGLPRRRPRAGAMAPAAPAAPAPWNQGSTDSD